MWSWFLCRIGFHDWSDWEMTNDYEDYPFLDFHHKCYNCGKEETKCP